MRLVVGEDGTPFLHGAQGWTIAGVHTYRLGYAVVVSRLSPTRACLSTYRTVRNKNVAVSLAHRALQGYDI